MVYLEQFLQELPERISSAFTPSASSRLSKDIFCVHDDNSGIVYFTKQASKSIFFKGYNLFFGLPAEEDERKIKVAFSHSRTNAQPVETMPKFGDYFGSPEKFSSASIETIREYGRFVSNGVLDNDIDDASVVSFNILKKQKKLDSDELFRAFYHKFKPIFAYLNAHVPK